MNWPDDYINKVICGDCLEVMKGIPDNAVDLVVTDPPYGMSWQSNRRIIRHKTISGDNNLDWLNPAFCEINRILKDNKLVLSFYGWPDADKFLVAFRDNNLRPKSHFCFVKEYIGLGWFTRGKHEVAYLLAKGEPSRPANAISDVISFPKETSDYHPTQKPVESIAKIVEAFSNVGDLILDPFLGSGTTAVAAKQLGRKYIGIEINPDYCKIAEQRLQQEILI